MSRSRRRLTVGILAALGGVAVAVVVLGPLLVPRERLRAAVLAELRRATGGEVEVADVSVRLVPRPALRLAHVMLSGTSEQLAAAGVDGGPRTYVIRDATVDVEMGPGVLLGGDVRVTGMRWRCPAAAWTDGWGHQKLQDFSGRVRGALSAAAQQAGGLVDWRLAAAAWEAPGARYDDVAAAGVLADGVLRLERVTAACGDGRLTGEGQIDFTAAAGGMARFALQGEAVPAPALLGPVLPDVAARLESALDLDLTGRASLSAGAPESVPLTLQGELDGGPGVLHAADWLAESRPYLGDRQDLLDVDFTALEHRFRFEDGRYLIDRLALTGGPSEWGGAGWVEPEGDLDVGVQVLLPAGFVPDLGAWSMLAKALRDDEGRISLAFRLTGRTALPQLGIDLQRLLERGRRTP